MKNFELQPTTENLIATLEEDMIGRNVDIYHFVHLINQIDTAHSIALNAEWGAGKTFFVKQVKMILDAYNIHTSALSDDEKECVLASMQRFSAKDLEDILPEVTVYYDAWIHDNDQDPILSIVYSILQNMSTEYKFDCGTNAFEIAATIGEILTGYPLVTLKNALKKENPFEELKKQKTIENQIKEFLQALLPEHGNRLVIIIDELDRCTPSYAIKLLERIKHYFNDENITFIFSINSKELQHTVRKYYGNEFDACRYLDRFFDLSIELPPAKLDRLYEQIGIGDSRYVYEGVCQRVAELNHFSIRETLKFYRFARAAAYKPTHSHRGPCFGEEKAEELCLMYLVPIMLGLKMKNRTLYHEFIEGKNNGALLDFFDGEKEPTSVMRFLLGRDEAYHQTSGYKLVTAKDKLTEVYDALFVHSYGAGSRQVQIGETLFEKETRDKILKTIALLSQYTDYEV